MSEVDAEITGRADDALVESVVEVLSATFAPEGLAGPVAPRSWA